MDEVHGPRRLSIPAAIGALLLCWAAAAISALGLLSCIHENWDHIPRVCYSATAQTVYEAIAIASAGIALLAAAVGHVRDRRRIAQLGFALSLALLGAAIVWGFHTGAHQPYSR